MINETNVLVERNSIRVFAVAPFRRRPLEGDTYEKRVGYQRLHTLTRYDDGGVSLVDPVVGPDILDVFRFEGRVPNA